MRPAAAQQVGWLGCPDAQPADDREFLVDSDAVGDGGNPCIGIAIGCLLSLPLWAGLFTVVYLLR